MRSVLAKLLFLILIALLAGCGADEEGESTGDSPVPEGASVGAEDGITLFRSGGSLQTGRNKTIEVTARVKASSGQLLEGVPVRFSVSDSGVSFQAADGTQTSGSAFLTDASGAASVLLSSPNNRSNRTIEITASVDGVESDALVIPVDGTSILLQGPKSATVTNEVEFTATLSDSEGEAIEGRSLSFSSQNGGSFSPSEAQTDSNGRVVTNFTVTGSGTDTISVEGAGANTSSTLNLTSQLMEFSTPQEGQELDLGTNQTVEVTLTDGGTAVAGASVDFRSTRGVFSPTSDTTDGSGVASTTFNTGTDAGPAIITAESGDALGQTEVLLVATNPETMDLQANPGTVRPGGESTITAVVRNSDNQPVKNQTVDFSIIDDTTGSTLRSPTAQTDRFGKASVTFVAGDSSGASEGTTIEAVVQEDTSVTATTSVTVSGEALFITLGTGNTVAKRAQTQYVKPYTVLVTDSSGNPVEDVVVSLSAVPTAYGKGFFSFDATLGRWVRNDAVDPFCNNEDLNRNGQLDAGEDVNSDGVLWPGNVTSLEIPDEFATDSSGQVRTDSTGFANFNVAYPQDHGQWVKIDLTGKTNVAGTESVRTVNFLLPIAADDLTNEDVPPAADPSPFGTATTCADPS